MEGGDEARLDLAIIEIADLPEETAIPWRIRIEVGGDRSQEGLREKTELREHVESESAAKSGEESIGGRFGEALEGFPPARHARRLARLDARIAFGHQFPDPISDVGDLVGRLDRADARRFGEQQTTTPFGEALEDVEPGVDLLVGREEIAEDHHRGVDLGQQASEICGLPGGVEGFDEVTERTVFGKPSRSRVVRGKRVTDEENEIRGSVLDQPVGEGSEPGHRVPAEKDDPLLGRIPRRTSSKRCPKQVREGIDAHRTEVAPDLVVLPGVEELLPIPSRVGGDAIHPGRLIRSGSGLAGPVPAFSRFGIESHERGWEGLVLEGKGGKRGIEQRRLGPRVVLPVEGGVGAGTGPEVGEDIGDTSVSQDFPEMGEELLTLRVESAFAIELASGVLERLPLYFEAILERFDPRPVTGDLALAFFEGPAQERSFGVARVDLALVQGKAFLQAASFGFQDLDPSCEFDSGRPARVERIRKTRPGGRARRVDGGRVRCRDAVRGWFREAGAQFGDLALLQPARFEGHLELASQRAQLRADAGQLIGCPIGIRSRAGILCGLALGRGGRRGPIRVGMGL